MKALHFGAGNIGRGFIGYILADNGYNVTFADVNHDIVDALKQDQSYTVSLANKAHTQTVVTHVTALHSIEETQALEEAILEADLITTAVGVNVLPIIAKSLAPVLKQRKSAVNVVACENAINATDQLQNALEAQVGPFEAHIHFSNAAVDRIVPIQHHTNILDVTVEPFYEWVIESETWYGPKLKGVKYVENLAPYIERKLLTVNTGHAYLAYAGQYYHHHTILEAINDAKIESGLERVLKETSAYITAYFDFEEKAMKTYRNTIIERYQNPYLSDDIIRVGRGVLRKLGPNDRIMKPLKALHTAGQTHTALIELAAYALHYQDQNDTDTVEKNLRMQEEGIQPFLMQHAEVNEDLAQEIEDAYHTL